jgi:glutathione S-transferase
VSTTLTYFDYPGGRGEDCRIALHLAGVAFTDDRVQGDWAARRGDTPYGSLPVLDEDGRKLAQSNVILAYLGRRHGLHPADPWRAAVHEEVMASVEDLRQRMPNPTDPDEKRAAREAFAAGWVRRWAETVSGHVVGPFLEGDALHVADLKLYVLLKGLLAGAYDHVGPEAIAEFPALRALHDAVAAHPGVVSWNAR